MLTAKTLRKKFFTAYLITTERLGLRHWKEDDFPPFAAMNKDEDVMRYYPSILSDEETVAMMERINGHFQTHGFGLFAVEKRDTKEFIGYTGFMIPRFQSFFTPCVEIGWRIKKEEWNKGFATEAATACLHYGFETLGFDKIYSFTSVVNQPSERVMQKTGMKKEGEFGHPNLSTDSPLCRHVLYKIERETTKTREEKPA